MNQYQKALKIQTVGKSFHDITDKIEKAVTESGIKTGLCHLSLMEQFIPQQS